MSLGHSTRCSSSSVAAFPDERSQDSHLEGFPEVKSGLDWTPHSAISPFEPNGNAQRFDQNAKECDCSHPLLLSTMQAVEVARLHLSCPRTRLGVDTEHFTRSAQLSSKMELLGYMLNLVFCLWLAVFFNVHIGCYSKKPDCLGEIWRMLSAL